MRGRTDRRRTAIVAAGVLLGGLGLLVSGAWLGSMDDDGEGGDVTSRIEESVANVVVVDEGVSTTTTGLVLDHDGHLVVSASALGGADEIWARCADGRMESATVVAMDEAQDLAVVRIDAVAGRPATVAPMVPTPGAEVVAVESVPGAVTTSDVRVTPSTASTPTDRFHVELASSDGGTSLLFDQAGALVGMTGNETSNGSSTEVRSASSTVGAAKQLIAG